MKGWECPKCGAVWAPFVTYCANCNKPTSPPPPLPWAGAGTAAGAFVDR